MSYALQFQKSDTLNASIGSGDTTATLNSGNFGSPTNTQILVIDYDVPAKAEVVSCTITGTAITAMVRGLDGTTGVAHSQNANVVMAWVPSHHNALTNITTDTDGATVTFDLSSAYKHVVVLGGNRTLALTNVTAGQMFAIKLTQDGTGSRTVTWFSGITWASAITPTLTTTANKSDWFGFIAKTTSTFDGFILGQNF